MTICTGSCSTSIQKILDLGAGGFYYWRSLKINRMKGLAMIACFGH